MMHQLYEHFINDLNYNEMNDMMFLIDCFINEIDTLLYVVMYLRMHEVDDQVLALIIL